MARTNFSNISIHEPVHKKTSIGGKASSIKTSSMNKHKRRSYKQYRGQGK
jgi:hypothetical protein